MLQRNGLLQEWHGGVLLRLFKLSKSKFFDGQSFTIPALASELLKNEKFVSESVLRKYLYELRDCGVLSKSVAIRYKARTEDGFVFNEAIAKKYFLKKFEETELFELAHDFIYFLIQH